MDLGCKGKVRLGFQGGETLDVGGDRRCHFNSWEGAVGWMRGRMAWEEKNTGN
jgi:hypothetical protein